MPVSASTFRSAPNKIETSKTLSPVVALLAISVFINYIDRGSLSIAAPALKDELDFSAGQLGMFALLVFLDLRWFSNPFRVARRPLQRQLGHGWGLFCLVHRHRRYGPHSRLSDALGHAPTFGCGRVCGLPVLQQNPRQAFPRVCARTRQCVHRRGHRRRACIWNIFRRDTHGALWLAAILRRIGTYLSSMAVSVVEVDAQGPWNGSLKQGASSQHSGNLKQRSAWGTFAGLFSYNYLSYFLLTWLPFYLVRERHFSMQNMGGSAAPLI